MKRVENGTPAIVRAVDPERGEVVLELDEFDQGATGTRTLRVGREAPVELGYARHVYKAQGVTRHTADMAVSLRTHLNELYVMVSRAREGARIHALAVELEEAAEDAAEAQLEAEMAEPPRGADHGPQSQPGERADRPLPAEGRQLELLQLAEAKPSTAEGEAGSPEGQVDLAAELREARARQQANRELATIGEIGRRAMPSTKEAIGERPPAPASELEPSWQRTGGARGRWSAGRDADRQDRGARRWFTSPSLDAEAPQQARETARRAAERKVPERRPRHTERAARSFPSRDPVESIGRHHLEQADTPKALANYEVAGKVEYTADPMVRAIERLEADRHSVLVVMPGQMERARSELSRRPELAADVERRRRLVDAEVAYQNRLHRREAWTAHHSDRPDVIAHVEPDAIRRAYVVADEPWATQELRRATSLAAESHLVTTPPRQIIAEQTAAEVERIRQGLARHEAQRAEARDHQVQQYVRQRSFQAEYQPGRPAERGRAERGA
jgi:hypothetical protein